MAGVLDKLKQYGSSEKKLTKHYVQTRSEMPEKMNGSMRMEQVRRRETENGISYEEFQKLQAAWKAFEEQMNGRFSQQGTQINGVTQQVRQLAGESLEKQTDEVRRIVEAGLTGQNEKMQNVVSEAMSGQENVITSAIQNQMYGFRTELAEAMGDEIKDYNRNVSHLYSELQKSVEDELEKQGKSIKKDISLVQELLEDLVQEQSKAIQEEVMKSRTAGRGYTRMAMIASFISLIVLVLDIFVLK